MYEENSRSRQVSFNGTALPGLGKGGNDASSKHLETNNGGAVPRKNSLIQKIKDYQVQRRSEKFYRFLHHDLSLAVTYMGSLCVLFHLVCALVREGTVGVTLVIMINPDFTSVNFFFAIQYYYQRSTP